MRPLCSFQFSRLTMLSFLEKVNESQGLNRRWGVSHAVSSGACVINNVQSPITTDLDFGIICWEAFVTINYPVPQLQYHINHQYESQIPAIGANSQETAIYFLQFLMINTQNACNIDFGSLVDWTAGDIVNAIERSWIPIFCLPWFLQKNWKLQSSLTVPHI